MVNCQPWAFRLRRRETKVERGRPVRNVVAFVNPSLVISVARGKLKSGVLVNGVAGVPVVEEKFS